MKDNGRLIKKQFIITMFLARYRHKDISFDKGKDNCKKRNTNENFTDNIMSILKTTFCLDDLTSHLSEFSHCLRHCEKALQEIENYKFFSLVTASELRRNFSEAFQKFELTLKQISQSKIPQDTSQEPDFNRKCVFMFSLMHVILTSFIYIK